MRIRNSLAVAAIIAGVGGLLVPALAQSQGGAERAPGQGIGQMENGGHMGRGMMSGGMMGGGMMGGGMMGGGCAGMMESMNGGGGRPNSQWHAHPPGNSTQD